MKTKRQPYLKSKDLAVELEKSQQQGSPTEQVCVYFKMIAWHLLGDSRYRKYSNDMHEDMVSAALIKCIKNIKNYKPQYADKCFAYFTRCVEHAFWSVLGKYYKHINMVRELTLEFADQVEQYSPALAQQIRDKQITVEHTKDKLTVKQSKEELLERMSKASKGMKFYNNGEITIRAKECPKGFKRGMIRHGQRRNRKHDAKDIEADTRLQ